MRIPQTVLFILTYAVLVWFPGDARGQRLDPIIAERSAERTGTLRGKIVLAGTYKPAIGLKVFKNRNYCGSRVANETLLVSRNGGVRNAAVILTPLERIPIVEPRSIVLDNSRCRFVPHVQITTVGSELTLTNSDPI